jgi:hypothetical protein
MCQECVTEGRMTQAELDEAIKSGDTTVTPMLELPPKAYLVAVTEVLAEALAGGLPLGEGLKLADSFLEAYVIARSEIGKPLSEKDLADIPRTYSEAKGEKA